MTLYGFVLRREETHRKSKKNPTIIKIVKFWSKDIVEITIIMMARQTILT